MYKSPQIEEIPDYEESEAKVEQPLPIPAETEEKRPAEEPKEPGPPPAATSEATTDEPPIPVLSPEELQGVRCWEERIAAADSLKAEGNGFFSRSEFLEKPQLPPQYPSELSNLPIWGQSWGQKCDLTLGPQAIEKYSQALALLPEGHSLTAVFYANRAASYLSLKEYAKVVEDADKGLKVDPKYVKLLLRRAQASEALGKLEQALADYQQVHALDAKIDVRKQLAELPPKVKEKQEREKEEMIDQLKGLGNKFLGLFGLSTDNFKLEKDANGGMKINFKQ